MGGGSDEGVFFEVLRGLSLKMRHKPCAPCQAARSMEGFGADSGAPFMDIGGVCWVRCALLSLPLVTVL